MLFFTAAFPCQKMVEITICTCMFEHTYTSAPIKATWTHAQYTRNKAYAYTPTGPHAHAILPTYALLHIWGQVCVLQARWRQKEPQGHGRVPAWPNCIRIWNSGAQSQNFCGGQVEFVVLGWEYMSIYVFVFLCVSWGMLKKGFVVTWVFVQFLRMHASCMYTCVCIFMYVCTRMYVYVQWSNHWSTEP
jgi:hypothetical protein